MMDDGDSVPMGGVRSSEGVRPLEGEARALEIAGSRARAREAGAQAGERLVP